MTSGLSALRRSPNLLARASQVDREIFRPFVFLE
jgi:hypothetical protein